MNINPCKINLECKFLKFRFDLTHMLKKSTCKFMIALLIYKHIFMYIISSNEILLTHILHLFKLVTEHTECGLGGHVITSGKMDLG
jgi:hypothetical protein